MTKLMFAISIAQSSNVKPGTNTIYEDVSVDETSSCGSSVESVLEGICDHVSFDLVPDNNIGAASCRGRH